MKAILWLAMETTGLGADGDYSAALPTEVSTLVTDEAYNPLGGSSDGITLTKAHAKALKADPKLLQFLKDRSALHTEETVSLSEAQADILDMLDDLDLESGKVMLAGRGAAHFIQPVLREHMPDLEKFLTYYPLDTSQMTRWVRLSGATDKLRSHRVQAPEAAQILKGMHKSTRSTLREVLTEAHQFRAMLKEA